jgi:hypothetical protein
MKHKYEKIEIKTGFWKEHSMMVLVLKEQGAYEIKALKPLNLNMVKNHELVMISSAKYYLFASSSSSCTLSALLKFESSPVSFMICQNLSLKR